MRTAVFPVLLAMAAVAAHGALELQGRITPPRRAAVTLYDAYSPFTAFTQTGPDGRFRFKKLRAGTYNLSVAVPGVGETRRTVEVTPKFADSHGTVEVDVSFDSAITEGGVSAKELSLPKAALASYARAQERLTEHDVTAATRELERAVAIAPHFGQAWNNLGTIAYQSQRFAAAEEYFRKALEADPTQYSPLVNLGGVLLNLSRPSEALTYNERAVRRQPRDALANLQLGLSYYFLGDLDAAEKYLTIAKEIDPALFSGPQLVLAEIHMRRGDRAGAVRELEDFVARHPDAPEAGRIRERIERLRAKP